MNVAHNISNEGLSQGFIYDAAFKKRLVDKLHLQVFFMCWCREV